MTSGCKYYLMPHKLVPSSTTISSHSQLFSHLRLFPVVQCYPEFLLAPPPRSNNSSLTILSRLIVTKCDRPKAGTRRHESNSSWALKIELRHRDVYAWYTPKLDQIAGIFRENQTHRSRRCITYSIQLSDLCYIFTAILTFRLGVTVTCTYTVTFAPWNTCNLLSAIGLVRVPYPRHGTPRKKSTTSDHCV